MNETLVHSILEEFRLTFLGKDFKWRETQYNAILQILECYYNETHKHVICQLPPGTGKSILAMAISYVINKNLKKTGHNENGYILTSDTSLQDQYEKDLKKFNIDWGSVKGTDNYKCIDNDEKYSLGTCKIRNKSPKSFPCNKDCPYICAKNKASASNTSVLNYSYWLVMMNYVLKKSMIDENPNAIEAPFYPRSFTICDEAHFVLDVVQNHFSPRIDNKFLEKIEKLVSFFNTYKVKDLWKEFYEIKQLTSLLFKEDNVNILFNTIKQIEIILEKQMIYVNLFKDKINKEYPNETPPKEWREAIFLCDYVKDIHCKLEDYVDIIEKTSTSFLIKNPQGEKDIVFNCLEEKHLMNNHFHSYNNFTVYMSATIGDPKVFLTSIGITNAKYINAASDFDFSSSPIYFYNKRKMSYNHLENNLPWLANEIDNILNNHKGESGIIHTASYQLTMKIFEKLSKENKRRILLYNGTEEKKSVLEVFKRNKGKILMAPSLMTGLDLPDELSRLQIVAKISYPSLSDKYISAKMNINPKWYNGKAIQNLIQSIGRSIRHKNDYATTYIMDACLSDLIHNNRSAFPHEFYQRLKIISE